MKQAYLYFLIVLAIYPLLGCQKSSKPIAQLDNNSYITNFELLQKNTSNDTRIIVTSPKATLDQTNNIIEIVKSSIEIINKDGQEFARIIGSIDFEDKNFINWIKKYN